MKKHASIPNEYADIFDGLLQDGQFNDREFYIRRDNFFQFYRNLARKNHREEINKAFEKEPNIDNEFLYRIASATAKYYCRVLQINDPAWIKATPYTVLMPKEGEAREMQRMLEETPPEFLEYGCIYPEKDLKIL